MKLYTYFQSGGAYRVRIALNLKGLKAEMIYVNLLKAEHQQAKYESINPQRLIPSLIDKEHTLTQSLVIMEYLEEMYHAIPLLTKDPYSRAYIRSLSHIIASDTAPLGNLKVRKYMQNSMGVDETNVKQWLQHWFAEGLSAFERTLVHENYAGDFCCGNTPTMADCCLMPQIYNARRWKCDLAHYPRIMGIVESCEKHPAFIAAHPSQQADATT